MACEASWPTARPTPAIANTAPSAESICGSSAAQPSRSINLRPSSSAASTFSRNRTRHSATAIIAANASPTSVACMGSISGSPPMTTRLRTTEANTVTIGIASAGTKMRLPNLCASRLRWSGVVVAGRPTPNPTVPAIATIAITSRPLPKSPSRSPNRKLAANSAQNPAFIQRFGLPPSKALITATTANSRPANT